MPSVGGWPDPRPRTTIDRLRRPAATAQAQSAILEVPMRELCDRLPDLDAYLPGQAIPRGPLLTELERPTFGVATPFALGNLGDAELDALATELYVTIDDVSKDHPTWPRRGRWLGSNPC